MHIRKLTAHTGVAERQVRYLIAEGFIPPPRGGRANAITAKITSRRIDRYARLRDLGFPPALSNFSFKRARCPISGRTWNHACC